MRAHRHMIHLAAALRFITVLPAGPTGAYHPREMVPFFPAVGLVVGLMLAGVDAACAGILDRPAAAAVDVVFLAAVTGAFHLDGLADTADGLFSHKDRQAALSIMKDSRIGVMGAAAVACLLLVKYGAFSALLLSESAGWRRFLVLLAIPAYARSAMLLGIRFLPYARPEGGTGAALFAVPLSPPDFWGLFACVLLSLLLGWPALMINTVFFASCACLILFYRRRVGGVTGDMLGAMSEITETLLLLFAGAAI